MMTLQQLFRTLKRAKADDLTDDCLVLVYDPKIDELAVVSLQDLSLKRAGNE